MLTRIFEFIKFIEIHRNALIIFRPFHFWSMSSCDLVRVSTTALVYESLFCSSVFYSVFYSPCRNKTSSIRVTTIFNCNNFKLFKFKFKIFSSFKFLARLLSSRKVYFACQYFILYFTRRVEIKQAASELQQFLIATISNYLNLNSKFFLVSSF